MTRVLPLVLCLLLVACGPPSPPSTSGFAHLEAQGEVVADALEAHRSSHGTYPDDPEAAGIPLPEAPYGGWRYHLVEEGEGFQLAIGDYGEDFFTVFWDSRSGEWYRDT